MDSMVCRARGAADDGSKMGRAQAFEHDARSPADQRRAPRSRAVGRRRRDSGVLRSSLHADAVHSLSYSARRSDLDLEVFDHGVGEKLVGHATKSSCDVRSPRLLLVHFDFDQFADSDGAYPLEPELTEGATNGVALGIEHFGLGPDDDRRFHRELPSPRFFAIRAKGGLVSATKGSPVICSNAAI